MVVTGALDALLCVIFPFSAVKILKSEQCPKCPETFEPSLATGNFHDDPPLCGLLVKSRKLL